MEDDRFKRSDDAFAAERKGAPPTPPPREARKIKPGDPLNAIADALDDLNRTLLEHALDPVISIEVTQATRKALALAGGTSARYAPGAVGGIQVDKIAGVRLLSMPTPIPPGTPASGGVPAGGYAVNSPYSTWPRR